MGDGPLDDFSSGYYSIELRVTPFEDGPTIDHRLFDYIESKVYANTDAPVWMRASFQPSPYFKLQGEEPMPTDLIGLPSEWMDDLGLDDDNELQTFFVCKPGQAHFLSQSVLWGDTYEDDDA